MPDHLGEMAGGRRKSRLCEVVILDFVVPALNRCLSTRIAGGKVLADATSGAVLKAALQEAEKLGHKKVPKVRKDRFQAAIADL